MGGQYGDWYRWKNELFHAFSLTYNYYLARLDIGGVFGQYWTLFVEIHFAIIFILLFGIIRNNKARKTICVAIILLTIFVFRPLTPAGEVRYETHAQLDSLFVGVLIALLEDKNVVLKCKIHHLIKPLISMVLCAILLISCYMFDTYYNNMNVKYVFYLIVGSFIFGLAKRNDGWFNFGKVINKILDFVGDASASTYISHVIIYSCIYYNIYYNTEIIPATIKNSCWGIVLQVVILEIVAILVGWLSSQLIEKPYALLTKKIIKKKDNRSN